MGKYKYLNSQEIVNRIEVYGTEEEREILEAFVRHSFENECDYCIDMQRLFDESDEKVSRLENSIDLIEEILDNDLSDAGKLANIRARLS